MFGNSWMEAKPHEAICLIVITSFPSPCAGLDDNYLLVRSILSLHWIHRNMLFAVATLVYPLSTSLRMYFLYRACHSSYNPLVCDVYYLKGKYHLYLHVRNFDISLCCTGTESGRGVRYAAGGAFSELPCVCQPSALHGQLLQRPLPVRPPTLNVTVTGN